MSFEGPAGPVIGIVSISLVSSMIEYVSGTEYGPVIGIVSMSFVSSMIEYVLSTEYVSGVFLTPDRRGLRSPVDLGPVLAMLYLPNIMFDDRAVSSA